MKKFTEDAIKFKMDDSMYLSCLCFQALPCTFCNYFAGVWPNVWFLSCMQLLICMTLMLRRLEPWPALVSSCAASMFWSFPCIVIGWEQGGLQENCEWKLDWTTKAREKAQVRMTLCWLFLVLFPISVMFTHFFVFGLFSYSESEYFKQTMRQGGPAKPKEPRIPRMPQL